jgi:hypothetical protein
MFHGLFLYTKYGRCGVTVNSAPKPCIFMIFHETVAKKLLLTSSCMSTRSAATGQIVVNLCIWIITNIGRSSSSVRKAGQAQHALDIRHFLYQLFKTSLHIV